MKLIRMGSGSVRKEKLETDRPSVADYRVIYYEFNTVLYYHVTAHLYTGPYTIKLNVSDYTAHVLILT